MIEYYQNIAREEIALNKERNRIYREIDDMIELRYKLPKALTDLEWIGDRKHVSNAPRNAAMSATRAFATLMPNINIDPATPEPEEWERAERAETALDWEFQQLNYGKSQPPHWRIIDSSVRYCNVSMQTEYYPYSDKRTGMKKKRRGNFSFIVHHPSSVNGRFSHDALECVVLAQERSVQDVIYQWGEGNEGVQKLLKDMKEKRDTSGADRRKTPVSYFEYWDDKKRVIWCTLMHGSSLENNVGGAKEACVIMNEEHGLPFIPWVIVDNKEPILKGVYDTWINANIIKTIKYAKHVSLAGHPSFWVRKLSPTDHVEIDSSSPLNIAELTQGQDVGTLPPPPLDPQLAQTEADLDSQIYQSSAASVLGSVESLVGGNTPFSSINAVLQAALAQLGMAKLTAEYAEAEGFCQILKWIDYSDEPLIGYRKSTKNTDGKEMARGEQIMLRGGSPPEEIGNENVVYIDPDETYITVTLNANTITDEQGRVTSEINKVERLGFSQRSAYERIGGMNFEQEQEQRAAELLFQTELELAIKQKHAEVDLAIQAQQMQMQMQAQQVQMQQQQEMQMAAQNQQMNAEGAFEGAQGIDTRGGGIAAQQSAPGVGREQVNQADANGVALA